MSIIIIGILSVTAVPKFFNIKGEAEYASMMATAGAVKSGITLYFASMKGDTFPETLDTAPENSGAGKTNMFFTEVLINGTSDSNWYKTNDSLYTYKNGTSVHEWKYTKSDGSFILVSSTDPNSFPGGGTTNNNFTGGGQTQSIFPGSGNGIGLGNKGQGVGNGSGNGTSNQGIGNN